MPITGNLPDKLYVGLGYETVTDIDECLSYARDANFDFFTAPLAVPEFDRTEKDQMVDPNPWTRSDLLLKCDTWRSCVFGKVSSWIDCDSSSSRVRADSVAALTQELLWAVHVGAYGALLPAPKHGLRVENYCKALNTFFSRHPANSKWWIRIPLVCAVETPEGTSLVDGWEVWDKMRRLLDYNTNVSISLTFTDNLPASDNALKRWLCEDVKVVDLPCTVFVKNKNGYPVLSKRHKALMVSLFHHKVQVFLSPGTHFENVNIGEYLNYVARLFTQQEALGGVESFAHELRDHLQEPLQPLADNLESQIYEVFEQDPVKYVRYEEAVLACLRDKIKLRKDANKDTPASPEQASKKATPPSPEQAHPTGNSGAGEEISEGSSSSSSDEGEQEPMFTIMVVGAGRGPLVVAARQAAMRAGVHDQVRIYAVEKNVNAVVTLRCRKISDKWDNVTIISHDMRTWDAPCKADIMVSELLGSFGDNELSPECLDGAQEFLAEDGVSIPQMYYSTIRPVSTTKLWSELRKQNDPAKFECPYVVYLHQAWYPCEAQKVFTYEHPNWLKETNDRYGTYSFEASESFCCTGFAGYFHCDLYKDISISIDPATYSEGMFSWFPIYFPVKTPFRVEKGEKVTLHMWRVSTDSNAWYEWNVSSPRVLPIHNVAGESYAIGK